MPQLPEERRAVTLDEPHDKGPFRHIRHNHRILPVLCQRLWPLLEPARASTSETPAHNHPGFGITYDNGIPSIHTCLYIHSLHGSKNGKHGVTGTAAIFSIIIIYHHQIGSFSPPQFSIIKGIRCWAGWESIGREKEDRAALKQYTHFLTN